MSHQSSTLDLLLVTWASSSVISCLLVCAIHSHISEVNAKLPRRAESNLIYLDDIIIFSQIAEEHLHCLHIVFHQFREHNLKLKPSECDSFRDEVTYQAHQVLKDGVCSSNMKAIPNCTLPQTYTEVHSLLGLVGHYRRLSKDLHILHSPLVSISLGKGPAGSQSRCHFPRKP